jgi:glycosyltransferase involved in cell wall biosynthesis
MTTRVSLVIPTHNRRATLQRNLRALARQSYPLSQIDVVIVADGCTDGTEHVVLEPPLSGRVVAQAHGGAAVARNTGAALATGDLLLFLDDDVEAWPELVDAHVRAHAPISADALIVGYLQPRPENTGSLFRVALGAWFETTFERMRQPGHRFTYADVLTGNCSVPRRFFQALRGFQPQLRCHEDYELGLRVLAAGGAIGFAPAAGGWHEDVSDLERSLQRKRDEGTADVWIARAHNHVWPVLPLARPIGSRRFRLLRDFALNRPRLGGLFHSPTRSFADLLARARLRTRWREVIDDLLFYWYWRGVGDALKNTSFDRFREEITSALPPPPDLPCLDLQHGLEAAMHELDDLDAPGVALHYRGVYVGTIAPKPWAEPLRGRHLRPLLSMSLHAPFAEALATALGLGTTGSAAEAARVLISATPRAS